MCAASLLQSPLSRRGFVAAAAAAGVLAACGTAHAEDGDQAPSYSPGTYTASAQGKAADVEVTVVFSEDAIEDIQIGENYETAGVSDLAFARIPAAIVEQQSLAVDTVAGATLTSWAILNAVEDCVRQAGANVDALWRSTASKSEPRHIVQEADVVVVGGGGAGSIAAIAAAEAGARVVVLEKADYLGGNTAVSGGIFNAADPERQAALEMTDALRQAVEDALAEEPANPGHAQLQADVRAAFEDYLASGKTSLFDDPAWHALQTYNGGDKLANVELVRVLTGNALASLKEVESMGMEYKEGVDQAGGALWQRTHRPTSVLGTGYFKAYNAQMERYGDQIQIAYRANATSLVTEDGRVTGVLAEDRDGNTYEFTATRGVIMATGGFASNVELRQQYCESDKWPDLGPDLKTTNMSTVTGDGIFMARDAGANLVDMDQIQLLHSCCQRTGDADWALKYSVGTSIFVNQNGERFINEDARRDELCLAIFEQPGKMMWIIQSGDTYPNPDEMIMNGGVPLAKCVATGDAFYADTLEELAEKIGMPADALVQTVEEYNQAVETGQDRLGKKVFVDKLVTGPFYALNRAPSAHHTMGGVQIDASCHVLDTAGNPIPGLYAAGEVTGGIHGGNRLGGNAVADTVVFGLIAGRSAAAAE